MAGKLEYSLGLATTSFLGPLGAARGALAGFIGLATGGAGLIAGVFNEINRGAALKDLSNRTQESVGNLFKLQFAFEQSGVAAGSVGTILLRFQKSLSGVGEMGENTAEAFKALGLSAQQLRGLSSPEALLRVFESLNKLDRTSAADVASRLFGRGGAGEVLQLARDSKDVARSFEDAARKAKLLEANAEAFDRLGDTIGRLKLEVSTLFAGIAADITPFLNLLGQQVEEHDFAALGDTLGLALKAGIQDASFFLADEAQKWGDILRKQLGDASDAAQSPGFWKTLGKGALGSGAGLLGLWGQLGGALGIPGAQAKGDERIAQAEKLFQQIGWGGGILSNLAEVLAKSLAKSLGQRTNQFREALNKLIAEDKAKNEAGKLGVADAASNVLFALGGNGGAFAPLKMDANALQRSGLWNSPGSNKDSSAIRAGVQQLVKEVQMMSGWIRDKWGYMYQIPTNQ